MILLLLFSFFAGIITVLSPCILSILPILLATTTGQQRYKPLGIICGLIISFSCFTLLASSLVQLTGISPDIFRYIAIGMLIFFGLTMLVPPLDAFFTHITSWVSRIGTTVEKSSSVHNDFFNGFIVGIALGLIWTPCAGPVLATITVLAATQGISMTMFFITIAYSSGAALPMLLIMYGGNKLMSTTHSLLPYTKRIKKIGGIVIILTACAMLFNIDVLIQTHVTHYFPSLTIEQHPRINKELEKLKTTHGYHMKTENTHAPELVGITDWINSTPLSLQELRGKVVLLDFWTYSCINCIRTFPYLKKWYQTYKNNGFEIIGIHAPEFAFEKNVNNVQTAVKRFGITYPVALDNNYATWQAYDNHSWPAHYLINQQGMIVSHHFGEGNYQKTENSIRQLLGLSALTEEQKITPQAPITPEIYLGYARAEHYQPGTQLYKDQTHTYKYTIPVTINTVGVDGPWLIKKDCITSQDTCTLTLHFIAHAVYIVMEAPTPQEITVLLDGKPIPEKYYTKDTQPSGVIIVHEARMYEIVNFHDEYKDHVISITMPKAVSVYTFTFG